MKLMFEIYQQYLLCRKLHICENWSKYRYSIILFDTIWLKLEILHKSRLSLCWQINAFLFPVKQASSILFWGLQSTSHSSISWFCYLIWILIQCKFIHYFHFRSVKLDFIQVHKTQNRKLVLTFLPY